VQLHEGEQPTTEAPLRQVGTLNMLSSWLT